MISDDSTGCPDPRLWLGVASGSEAPEESARLAAHASRCAECAHRLRHAIQTMDDANSREEDEVVGTLRSAQPDWQRNMALRLAAGSRSPLLVKRLWIPLATAAALLVSAGSVWLVRRENRPPLNQLALAYTRERSMELRIPGAAYGPLRVSRGAGANRPAELLESEAQIERELPAHASDSGWLHAHGRAELLDPPTPESVAGAIRDLRLAADLTHPPSGREYAEVLVDLASAYYQRAVVEHRPIDYSMAIECLTQAMESDSSLAVAYFNRALVLEKKLDYLRARDDWNKYLSLDPNGEWSDEAREHLRAIGKTLGVVPQQDEDRLAKLAEFRLQSAMESGFRETAEVKALAGQMAAENQDLWLRDVLLNRKHPAVQVLASMVRSRASLRISEYPAEQERLTLVSQPNLPPSLRVWLTYESLFRRVHSPVARMEPEQLEQAIKLAHSHGYWWFWGELLLDGSSAQSARGDWAKATGAASAVRRMARARALPLLEMRAAQFLENDAANTGHYREAALLEQEQLAKFWVSPSRWLSAESFFAGMAWSEEALGRPGAASLSAQTAAETAGFAHALETQAVNLARAASFAQSGHTPGGQPSCSRAHSRSFPVSRKTPLPTTTERSPRRNTRQFRPARHSTP